MARWDDYEDDLVEANSWFMFWTWICVFTTIPHIRSHEDICEQKVRMQSSSFDSTD